MIFLCMAREFLVSMALCASMVGQAQQWEWIRTIQMGSVPANANVAMALDGDVLAVSISTELGGTTHIFTRHQGGLDQWGTLGTISSSDPWGGRSLALRNGVLAIGSPGATSAGPFTGAVRMFRIRPNDLTSPVQPYGSIDLPDAVGNERFGYTLAWSGDTLLASAVDRSSFHMTGAVFLCADGPEGFIPIGVLPAQWTDLQIPFMRWFGTSIAVSEGRIAVASPFTGFDIGNAEQNIGAVHVFKRDPATPLGWALDTVWFDPALDGAGSCSFDRIELGNEGLAFAGDQLVLDYSQRYIGSTGTALQPWQVHDPALMGCPECGLRIVGQDAGSWMFDGSAEPDQDEVQFTRGVAGWSSANGDLFIEWYRQSDDTWRTSVHRRDEGGPNAWGITSEVAELDACDDLRGPLVIDGGHLVRSSQRRGADCAVGTDLIELEFQIFDH